MVSNDLNQAQNASPTPDLQPEEVLSLVTAALDDGKAEDVSTIDVRGRTAITDFMVIASGNSTRHVKSLADAVHIKSKKSGIDVLGVEGGSDAEWVLVDVGDVLVHVMLPRTRAFYALEKLWSLQGDTPDDGDQDDEQVADNNA